MSERVIEENANASAVTLVDYGVGNTASVKRAFERLGATVDFTSDPERVAEARVLVLPGVGAFEPARKRLADSGLETALRSALANGARLLGLCVGYQLLFEESLEFGRHRGLGLVPGRVVPFPEGVRVPHIGWNQLLPGPRVSPLLGGLAPNPYVYFVHSFVAEGLPANLVAASCEHGGFTFPAALVKGSLWGCQFHPEKSSACGRAILTNFLKTGAA